MRSFLILKKEIAMINRNTRQGILALIAALILCLSGTASVSATEENADSGAAAAENTVTNPDSAGENG